MQNIVKTALSAGTFKTLVKALESAGLVDALSERGPFTVFAPSDEAFAKIPKETLESLLADKEQLTSVLKYHVASGMIYSKDITHPIDCRTLEGESLHVRTDKGVMVNSAHVVTPDIKCENGVIHVIDTVLLPKSYQRRQAA